MNMIKYNDNELLYLISQHNEAALELLLKKYIPLIKRRLADFKIKSRSYDDYYQECLITFFSTIQKFREEKNGIFNLFLDYAIKNKIKALLKKEEKYFYNVVLTEDLEHVGDFSGSDEYKVREFKTGILSDFEKDIYDKYYCERFKVSEIASLMNCDMKRIYNAVGRIKGKIYLLDKDEIVSGKKIEVFSPLEKEIYELYLKGLSVKEISKEKGYDIAKVCNALSRAKAKIK